MDIEGERRSRCEAANDHGVIACCQRTHDLYTNSSQPILSAAL